ncbi:MAG: PIG-L family deacetylase [Bacilli bacterium]|nr:PIG-L family deacetylase [Bacilli bacterium]
MKKILFLLTIILIPINVFAKDITSSSTITINNEKYTKITDNKENTYINVEKDKVINIKSNEDIAGIYIIYELNSQTGIIKANNKFIEIGTKGFLHEYIDLKDIGLTKELEITYNNNVKIGEIYILSAGELPSYVEVWEESCKEADLLLFTTHSDDEQLFFLGLLPTYVAKGASVQVVYFTNHNDNPKRLHEQLHGLYTVGIRNYPVMGLIPDAYSETLNGAIKNIEKAGLTVEDATNFEVEMIRRFKPLVVVGHDELGEYSHGQHILNTHVLKIALEKANDKTYHAESYDKYGIWDVPKTYLHLYKENKIIMNYDEPLEYFNSKTAYEVSKEGYSKHLSQQWTWFTKWINGSNNSYTKATDIKTYSPLEYGLYRTTVGEDINKNDMFENLIFRKDEVQEEVVENDKVINITDEGNQEYYSRYKNYIIIGTIFILTVTITLVSKKKNKVRK